MLVQSKLLRLRRIHRLLPSTFSSLRRCHSDSPSPSRKEHELTVTQVVEHLQNPPNDWDYDKLRPFLFEASHHLLPVTLRLNSIPKALDFINYLRSRTEHHQALSCVFEGALELATQHPNSQKELLILHSYRKSNGDNIALTSRSAFLLLKCLGEAQMVDDSLLLFKELDSSSKSSGICNELLKGLFKSGCIDDALHVIDEMLERDSDFPPDDFTGEVVFGVLGKQERHGRSFADDEIVGLVTKLCEHGVFPDAFKLTQMITKMCRHRKNGVAWELLHVVMRLGGAVVVKAASCNAMLSGLGRERDTQRMNKLMAEMEEMGIKPSVVTFGILVNHLCKARRIDEALEVFDKLRGKGEGNDRFDVEPDVVLFNTLIDGLCKVGREEHGLSLLEKMKTTKQSRPNAITYNCLIDGFCKAGNIGKARRLYSQMIEEGVQPSVVTLNTLVNGLCKHGKVHDAVEFFNEMKGKGLQGNAGTYTALISAFCGVNNIDKAMQYFDEMLSSGCSPDAIVYYSLINGLSIAGRMDDASVVVSRLKRAGYGLDVRCYNVLISGFCKKKKLERVYEMLNEMEETGVKSDIVTYNTLVSYLGKIGDFATASKMMKRMIKEGLEPSVVTYGAIIHAYCLKENVDEAMKIFEEMCSKSKVPPNTVIYNILIDALCKNGNVERAVSLMDDMKIKGVRPNTTTYNAIFKGVRDKKMLQKAFELMDRMIEDACSPDYITMEILTEWLDAVGEIEKLKCFVDGYPVSSSASSPFSKCML
ncbi:pentatricopeptide repeat-containing protein At3g61520, mitochondrial [Vigna radiata var. radiata]|uniref:Pentatricopeptide repeat-containing protein At3g61520, mitochondrial n=1 Tax=Vigna radiata var. radiata TaxID=3916 RepID=A0A1S3VS54_VIGRR|nr:pentatricopeptide repeat-containing protein At3g61520, mitochondrial [Vigna radiata var. radiata]